MEEYRNIEYPTLINMLAEYTSKYVKMLKNGLSHSKEFADCERKIILIQSVLKNKINIPTDSGNSEFKG